MNCHTEHTTAQATRGPAADALHGEHLAPRRGWGRGRVLGLVAAVAVLAALVAVLVFRVSLLTVAVVGMIALHPLLHMAGGHRHGGHGAPSAGAPRVDDTTPSGT